MAGYTYDTGTDQNVDADAVAEFFALAAEGRHTAVVCTLALYPDAIHWRRHMADAEGHDEDALYLACLKGHAHIAEILLEAKADIESLNMGKTMATPLMAAAYGHHEKVVGLLLARGANPNARDDNGFTPLVNAAASGDNGIVELLLKHGADPDVRGIGGTQPLAYAAFNNDATMIKTLMQYGARTDVKDDEGDDVIESAHKISRKMVPLIVQCAQERNQFRLKAEFDAAIDDMAHGTKAPLQLKKPLKLKAGI